MELFNLVPNVCGEIDFGKILSRMLMVTVQNDRLRSIFITNIQQNKCVFNQIAGDS